MAESVAEAVVTPNFDSYLSVGRIVATAAAHGGRSARVTWDDGLVNDFHVYALRENAVEADMMHPG